MVSCVTLSCRPITLYLIMNFNFAEFIDIFKYLNTNVYKFIENLLFIIYPNFEKYSQKSHFLHEKCPNK